MAISDTDKLVSANWISVSAALDIGYQPNIGRNTWISVKMLAYIGQNTSFRPNIGQNENIGIGGGYVGANISVSAKMLAGRIYRYWYRLAPYLSDPSLKATLQTHAPENFHSCTWGAEWRVLCLQQGPPSL